MKRFLIAAVMLLFVCEAAFAVYPQAKTIDDGNLTLFVLNTGSFGVDPGRTRQGFAGLYYPRTTSNALMAGGGIWVAGKKDGDWRITISGDESEFVPGPVGGGGVAADTTFRLYKITRGEDYAQNDDHRNWPASLGAPVDAFGRPLLRGSQSIFTMFNDLDTAAHVFTGFSGTLPLGVEVKLNVHTWDNDFQLFDTVLTQVVILDYTITNRGETAIDSCIVSLYADPDIGYSGNDRLGSKAEVQCAYVYNDSNIDSDLGDSPPVVGVVVLENLAGSMNYYYPCSRFYPECIPIDTLPKLLNLIRGLKPNGQPYFNPVTTFPTTFPFDGNPFDSTGWLADLSRDYRFILNTLPTDLAAGDSIKLKVALIVSKGATTKDGVRQFLETATMLRGLEKSDTLTPQFAISAENAVAVNGRRVIGKDWGGRYIGGGADLATRYLGFGASSDDLIPATLAIGRSGGQELLRFVPNGSRFEYAGKAEGNAGVSLLANEERQQCIFLDIDKDGLISNRSGKLDPFILTKLDYDVPVKWAIGRDLTTLSDRLLYAVQLDQSRDDVAGTEILFDGAMMEAEFGSIADYLGVSEPRSEAPTEFVFRITNNTRFVQQIDLISNDPLRIDFSTTSFDLGVGESRYVSMYSTAPYLADQDYEVFLHSHGFDDGVRRLPIYVQPTLITVAGDVDNDGELNFTDLLRMVRILYRDEPIVTPIRQIDADCDLRFGLLDLILFVNYLYMQTALPCDSAQR